MRGASGCQGLPRRRRLDYMLLTYIMFTMYVFVRQLTMHTIASINDEAHGYAPALPVRPPLRLVLRRDASDVRVVRRPRRHRSVASHWPVLWRAREIDGRCLRDI